MDLQEQIQNMELQMAMRKRKQYWPAWSDTPGGGNQPPHQAPGMPGQPQPNYDEMDMRRQLMQRGMSMEDILKLQQRRLDLYNNAAVFGNETRRPRFDVAPDHSQWDRRNLQDRMIFNQRFRKM